MLIDDLREVRALLQAGWTKGRDARNYCGMSVDPHHPSATAFCLRGAAMKVTDTHYSVAAGVCINKRYLAIMHALQRETGSPTYFNDHKGKAAVLEVLDGMIKRLELGTSRYEPWIGGYPFSTPLPAPEIVPVLVTTAHDKELVA